MSTINKLSSNLSVTERLSQLHSQLDRQSKDILRGLAKGKINSWAEAEKGSGLVFPAELTNKPFNPHHLKSAILLLKEQIKEELLRPPAPSPTSKTDTDTGETVDAVIDDEFTIIPSLRNNPSVRYVAYQERAVASLLRGYITHSYSGQALNARTQSGKTYIIGSLIRELYDRRFPALTDCLSPYPVLVITRASVVEQTRRRLDNCFGLKNGRDVDVTNIDKMRSGYGDYFLREEVVVRDGDSEVELSWIEPTSPALIVLDEAQSVKNINSTQSRIFQKYNELDGENHRILYSSATMFTRVIESKCFAVSTRLKF